MKPLTKVESRGRGDDTPLEQYQSRLLWLGQTGRRGARPVKRLTQGDVLRVTYRESERL